MYTSLATVFTSMAATTCAGMQLSVMINGICENVKSLISTCTLYEEVKVAEFPSTFPHQLELSFLIVDQAAGVGHEVEYLHTSGSLL